MLTIGKLAGLAATSTDSLRYYEREGLIAPAAKSQSGYRLYDADSIRRIRFIKQAQRCGFTLTEIRELLSLRSERSTCCGDIRKLAVEKKLQVESRIKAMKLISRALDRLIADCTEERKPVDACPILSALEEDESACAATR